MAIHLVDRHHFGHVEYLAVVLSTVQNELVGDRGSFVIDRLLIGGYFTFRLRDVETGNVKVGINIVYFPIEGNTV